MNPIFKHTLSSFILFGSMTAKSQTCELIKAETDQFTKKTNYVSEIALISNEDKEIAYRVRISDYPMVKYALHLSIIPTVKGLGCVDEKQPTTFLFEDGTTIKANNANNFNCKSITSTMYYVKGIGSKPFAKMLESLSTKKLKAVRVEMSNEIVDYTFTPDQAAELKEMISCAKAKLETLVK